MNVVAETKRSTAYGPPAPVQVFQHEWEFAKLLELYIERAPLAVLEVGTYHGGTLYHWLANAPKGALIVTVDSYAVGVDNRHLYQDWVPVNGGVTLEVVCGDSRAADTIDRVRDFAPFDWVFIDAGHYYPEVQADWGNYAPMADAGAVIALHDILTHPNHPEIEVERLWREIQQQGYVTQELVADPAADWGGIGVVYMP